MNKYEDVTALGDFVDLPLVATLATYRPDGTVLLSPVWHEWHDGGFNVCVNGDDVKARHVRREPRTSFVVYENDPPYRGVEVRATARIVTTDVEETWRRISIRYLGPEAGAAYAGDMSGTEVLIRIEPGDVRAWDFAGDF